MLSAIHVAGNGKPYISGGGYIQNVDIGGIIKVAVIHVLALGEGKNLRHTAARRFICPQCIFLDEGKFTLFFIVRKFDILIRNAQHDALAIVQHIIIRIKHLTGCTVKIQQEHTAVRIAQTVKFVHIVNLRLSVLTDGGNPVIVHNAGRTLIDLRNLRCRFIVNLRFQVPPAKLIDAVVNIHVGKRLLGVSRVIRLHGRANRGQIRPVHRLFVETTHKIQVIIRVQSVRQIHMRIIIDITPAAVQADLQHIHGIHPHLILKLQDSFHRISVLVCLDYLRIFQYLSAVRCNYLVGDPVDGG